MDNRRNEHISHHTECRETFYSRAVGSGSCAGGAGGAGGGGGGGGGTGAAAVAAAAAIGAAAKGTATCGGAPADAGPTEAGGAEWPPDPPPEVLTGRAHAGAVEGDGAEPDVGGGAGADRVAGAGAGAAWKGNAAKHAQLREGKAPVKVHT